MKIRITFIECFYTLQSVLAFIASFNGQRLLIMLSDEGTMILSVPASADITLVFLS